MKEEEGIERTAAAILAIWREVLGIADVGIDENFFDIGGSSLLATRIAGRLSLDLTTRQARYNEAVARLTQREAELLVLLMERPNQPISRGDIFDRLWALQGGLSLNVVDVYVGYLRTKFGDIARAGGPMIVTVRSRGFMLDLRDPGFRH